MHLTQLIAQMPVGQRNKRLYRIAQAMGVTLSTLRHWSNGTRQPTPQHALKLEALTQGQISRYELRPDIYGPKPINHPEEKNDAKF